MAAAPDLDTLRRYAVARSLFAPTTLAGAIRRLGFVQADPIRAPARAQDLTLRHRVRDYRAGDLERRYASLPIEEDFFVNYGYLPRATHQLMHPRTARVEWPAARAAQAQAVLDFVRERGVVHPREVDLHFAHGKTRNWFGGTSNASTQLLDDMHYRGLVRIACRQGGVRLYAAPDRPTADPPTDAPTDPAAAMDALIDIVVGKYAPLPARGLAQLVSHLRGGAPQWAHLRRDALLRAKARLAFARVDGSDWFWPAGETPASVRHRVGDAVRLLAPFDPVVWDRQRFELLWGWAYRFEAYTPATQRVRGYYALPLLWRDRVVGWGNLRVEQGRLCAELGYALRDPSREAGFKPALRAELEAMSRFLGLAEAPELRR